MPRKQYASMIWQFKGPFNKVDSRCKIDIFEGHNEMAWCLVVICGQLNEEGTGVSVTNACEYIATEVLFTRAHEWALALPSNPHGENLNFAPVQLVRANPLLSPNRICWIEHYPEGIYASKNESFDRVTFDLTSRIGGHGNLSGIQFRFEHPKWKRIERATVEGWIGGAL
jgi:hypothetical protein